jgi:demethylmenaquinone methyltransferase/2-methoxy-6-polyprenyl-1,4-benzoquinol methylase
MSEAGGRKSDKAQDVRAMFGAIARRYDLLNHLLSANIDKRWRHACVREVARRLARAPLAILDVGCGTADLSLAFSSLGPVVGCDFCHPMLSIGRNKIARRESAHRIFLVEGDALTLPFPDGSFDVVVSAFVLRNLADTQKGLLEMRRILRGGGVLGILDFSMPRVRMFGKLYSFYFHKILPRLGAWISGVDGPYNYLPESVQSFPEPEELKLRIKAAGFEDVEYRSFSGGIAVLMLARAG